MAELALCACDRGWYDPDEYNSCYECFLDRRAEYIDCIFCGQWHNPKFNTCFKCRAQSPERDEAGARLRQDIMLRDSFTCGYCGSFEGFLQIDHAKPCAEGGTADPWNLQVLCAECNRMKGRTWYQGSRHDKARIKLMHTYFTYLWTYLNEDQRAQLRRDADAYGDVFIHHARYRPKRHAFCIDCDSEDGINAPDVICYGCGRLCSGRRLSHSSGMYNSPLEVV